MRRNILKSFVAFSILFSVTSCSNDSFEDKFDKNATARFEKRKVELSNSLLSSDLGWKMTYFTDDSKMGGFTYVMKFNSDTEVEMIGDFEAVAGYDDPKILKKSEYKIGWSNTVSLLFSTPNHIHLLGNNSISPTDKLKGQGYKGDFEFLYYSSEADIINFRTVRDGINIVFEKATKADWTDLQLNQVTKSQLLTKRTIQVIEGTSSSIYNFKFDSKTRWASVLNNAKTESVNSNGGIGIGYRKDGIIISPAIELEDGTFISELKYENGVFSTTVGDNMIIIN